MNITYDKTALSERLTFIGIDDAAKQRLRGLQQVIGGSIEGALDQFYKKVRNTPQTARFFADEGHMTGAKKRQQSHWDLIATADFDERYVAGVSAVGKAHARLGLEPRWYIGGYALVIEQLVGAIIEHRWPAMFGKKKSEEMTKEIGVVLKAAMLDMDYAISIYLDELADARAKAEQEKARAEADRQAALGKLSEALNQLAAGDLHSRLTAALPTEFQAMADNFNSAATALHDAIADVHVTSKTIVGGAKGLSSAADDLARRTEQQAASLEESSAALHELAESVRMTADNASKASTVVAATQSEAKQSGTVVSEAVGAMGKIKASSEEIAAIIGVIDEIAFQTNLLALNAGVEAARAGEAGRGFAVVAQEVRSLAQRCASSAKEIKELISTSAEHVASGVSSVGAAGTAIGQMVERINEMTQLMTGIAAAAEEQSRAISEVNSAVGQMDQITQKNAAMVEETTMQTQGLMSEALELTRKINRFQISEQSMDQGGGSYRPERPASHGGESQRQGGGGYPAAARGNLALANAQAADAEDWQGF